MILFASAKRDFACICTLLLCLQLQSVSLYAFAKRHFAPFPQAASLCFFNISVCTDLQEQVLDSHMQYYSLHIYIIILLMQSNFYIAKCDFALFCAVFLT